MQKADGAALGREAAVALDVDERIDEHVGHRALDVDLFDAARELHAECRIELELVEDKTCDAVGAVRIEQPAFGAGRVQFLMHALQAQRRGHLREAQVEGLELDLESALLLSVGKRLLDAVEAAFVRELVVLVVGNAGPVPDGVDGGHLGPVLAFARELDLVHVDAGIGLGRFQPRHAIEARVARHRGADEAALEQI